MLGSPRKDNFEMDKTDCPNGPNKLKQKVSQFVSEKNRFSRIVFNFVQAREGRREPKGAPLLNSKFWLICLFNCLYFAICRKIKHGIFLTSQVKIDIRVGK